MSYVMIAAGSTRASSVRTLSIRALVIGAGVAAVSLLVAGAALGYWLSSQIGSPLTGGPALGVRAATPFAIEQLGALSGRLFKLESLAGQLSERLGAAHDATAKRPGEAARGRAGLSRCADRRCDDATRRSIVATIRTHRSLRAGAVVPFRRR